MALPWLLLHGDPLPPLVVGTASGAQSLGKDQLLENWTIVAIGPPPQAAALQRQWSPDAPAQLVAIASADAAQPPPSPATRAAKPSSEPLRIDRGLLVVTDVDGQCARRLGGWDGLRCLPVAVLVEPRGTVEFACTGADLSQAVAQALAHLAAV